MRTPNADFSSGLATRAPSGEHARRAASARKVRRNFDTDRQSNVFSERMIMSADPETRRESALQRRVRFELIFASIWLAIGLFLLPALIYLVGTLMLGPYGDNAGLVTFYVDFFKDLVEPSGRAWTLALGPLALITVLRLLFLDVRTRRDDDRGQDEEAPAPAPRTAGRVEPRVSLD